MNTSLRSLPSLSAPTRILLVDDDTLVRETHGCLLRTEGYEVETCTDGKHALVKLAFQPFDLVITDWRMPYLDGISLVLWLRAMNNLVPVIMITGADAAMELSPSMRNEFVAVLPKPLPTELLLAVVREALSPPVKTRPSNTEYLTEQLAAS